MIIFEATATKIANCHRYVRINFKAIAAASLIFYLRALLFSCCYLYADRGLIDKRARVFESVSKVLRTPTLSIRSIDDGDDA